jgi:hypothetical protein
MGSTRIAFAQDELMLTLAAESTKVQRAGFAWPLARNALMHCSARSAMLLVPVGNITNGS